MEDEALENCCSEAGFERLLKQEIDGQSIIIDSTCMHLKFSTITLI